MTPLAMAKATMRPAVPARDVRTEGEARVWKTAAEAAIYLGFGACKHPARAFRKFVRRYGIASCRRGRVLLFDPRDLDAAIGARRRPEGRKAGQV